MTIADKRRTEIMAACRELYNKMNFKDITIKEISTYTSFSRPSIYNYFTTKESIFLEIFREEYALWCDDMDLILKKNKSLSKEKFADKLAQTIDSRPMLLKLLSMNIYDLEESCSLDELISFKEVYKRALNTISYLLRTYFPELTEYDIEHFVYMFFPFMFGLYPYTNVTEKQKKAMETVQINYPKRRVYDFAYQTILTILNSNLNEGV